MDDLDQIRRVLEFRERIQAAGALSFKFATGDEFDKLLRVHLSRKVQGWLSKDTSISAATPDHASQREDTAQVEQDDIGLLDAIEAFQETFVTVNASIGTLGTATAELGERMKQHSDELSSIPRDNSGAVVDQRAARRVVTATALDFDHYADLTEATLPVYQKNFAVGVGYLVKAMEVAIDFGTPETYEIQRAEVRSQLAAMESNLSEAREKGLGFRNSLSSLPRIAKDFNIARRRAINALDATLSEFEANARFLNEIKI